MKHLTTAIFMTVLVAGGPGLNATALAVEHDMHSGMQQMHGKDHGGNCWRTSLNEEQSKKVNALQLAYTQKTSPLKARIKQARIELALLISADQPEQKAIDKKIDEIMKLQARKMRFKTDHQIEVRKLLTAEQRVNFDMKLLKKANRDHKAYSHGVWHH